MSKSFEFSGLFSPAVDREFLPTDNLKPGEGLTLSLNLDFLTLESMEMLEAEVNNIVNNAAGFLDAVTEVEEEPKKTRGKKQIAVAATKPIPVPKIELFVFEKARYRFFARALAGQQGENDPSQRLIRDWNLVKAGTKVPVSYETFIQMPPHGLAKLYRYVIGEANNPTSSEKKA